MSGVKSIGSVGVVVLSMITVGSSVGSGLTSREREIISYYTSQENQFITHMHYIIKLFIRASTSRRWTVLFDVTV